MGFDGRPTNTSSITIRFENGGIGQSIYSTLGTGGILPKHYAEVQAGKVSAATLRFGNLVFVQGCTGRSPTTGAIGADIKEQTTFALERIALILKEAGTSMDNVMTNTCYVTKREDLPGFNEAYLEYFKQDRPVRTTTIVNFGQPENLVEIWITLLMR